MNDAGPVEVTAIGRFQPADLGVLGCSQLRPVETGFPDGPAEAGGIGELAGEARGVDQQLLGHAAADDAGAADPERLGDSDAGAVAGRNARGANPTGARADNEEIMVEGCHLPPPLESHGPIRPGRSRVERTPDDARRPEISSATLDLATA